MDKPVKDNIESQFDFESKISSFSKAFEREFADIVRNEILSLDNIRGKLTLEKGSSRLINEIIKRINEAVQAGGYQTKLSRLLRQIDDVETTNLKLVEALNDRNLIVGVREERDLIIDDIVNRIASFDSFKVNITDEVRRIIVKSILEQKTIRDLGTELQLAIISSKNNNGILGRYVNQITTDSVSQYKGTVNNRIKERFSMDAVNYVGSLIDTSRPQCIRWIQQYNGVLLEDKPREETKLKYGLLDEEIKYVHDNIRNTDRVSGYGKPGKPYYIDLTADNFLTFRGGYGCRHEALPYKFSPKALLRAERIQKAYESNLRKIEQENAQKSLAA